MANFKPETYCLQTHQSGISSASSNIVHNQLEVDPKAFSENDFQLRSKKISKHSSSSELSAQQLMAKTMRTCCHDYSKIDRGARPESVVQLSNGVFKKLKLITRALNEVDTYLGNNQYSIDKSVMKYSFSLLETICFRNTIKTDTNNQKLERGEKGFVPSLYSIPCSNDSYQTLPPTQLLASLILLDETKMKIILIVYDIFYKCVTSSAFKETPETYARLSYGFISKLVCMLESTNCDERGFIKIIVHKIYGKMHRLRPLLRCAMCNVIESFSEEGWKLPGTAQILEILASIIGGFSVPLNDSYKGIFFRTLLPLTFSESIADFHNELTECIVKFIAKEPLLVPAAVSFITKKYSASPQRSKVFFLELVVKLLNISSIKPFMIDFPHLCKIASTEFCSPNLELSEKAVAILDHQATRSFLKGDRKCLDDVLSSALKGESSHWDSDSRMRSKFYIDSLVLGDSGVFKEVITRIKRSEAKRTAKKMQYDEFWRDMIRTKVQKNQPRNLEIRL